VRAAEGRRGIWRGRDDVSPRDSNTPAVGGELSHTLPIGKLMGISRQSKLGLKAHGVTTCGQLLALAERPERQEELAHVSGIAPDELRIVINRADMARVNGIGWMFGMMLESLGVQTVGDLARREPEELHEQLAGQNKERRMARRSPTLDEVTRWIAQARKLMSAPAH
jgi:predicted flap endonuclease-1-like 5' DNA nuclease